MIIEYYIFVFYLFLNNEVILDLEIRIEMVYFENIFFE